MVCGKLARRIAEVMIGNRPLTRETLFTLPKPRVHLFGHLINIVPRRVLGEEERAYIDLRLVLA